MPIPEISEVDDILEGYMPPAEPADIEAPKADPEPAPEPAPQGEPPVEGLPPAPPQDGSIVEDAPVEPVAPEPIVPNAPVVDPKDVQIQQYQDTIAAMQKTIETVSQQVNVSTPTPTPSSEIGVIPFLEKEEDLDKALNSVSNFNSLLSSVFAKAREVILAEAEQIAYSKAHTVYTQRSSANHFYEQNPDLANNKAYVGIVANEIAAANPTWDMEKIMENLATEVRARLKLTGSPAGAVPASTPIDGVPPQAPPPETPAFVPGSHTRHGAGGGSMTKIEKEVADLISD